MLLAAVAIAAGLVLLTKAADQFVDGAIRLAAVLRISPVVIGAVIVGFGTSAPELLVSVLAAVDGELDIAVGNIIGSNIANLTLVIGVAGAIAAITVDSSVLRREVPLAAGATLLFAVLLTGGLSRLDGLLLLVALAASVSWIVVGSGRAGNVELTAELAEELAEAASHRVPVEALRTVLGLIGTVAGARLLVTGAVSVAEDLGVSEALIGLTLVAVGTSLPELVTAVVAARKGAHDLIIGNVLGSNLFNSLAVGGVAAVVGPAALADGDLATRAAAVMVVTTALALIPVAVGRRLGRTAGVALLGLYVVSVPLIAA